MTLRVRSRLSFRPVQKSPVSSRGLPLQNCSQKKIPKMSDKALQLLPLFSATPPRTFLAYAESANITTIRASNKMSFIDFRFGQT